LRLEMRGWAPKTPGSEGEWVVSCWRSCQSLVGAPVARSGFNMTGDTRCCSQYSHKQRHTAIRAAHSRYGGGHTALLLHWHLQARDGPSLLVRSSYSTPSLSLPPTPLSPFLQRAPHQRGLSGLAHRGAALDCMPQPPDVPRHQRSAPPSFPPLPPCTLPPPRPPTAVNPSLCWVGSPVWWPVARHQ